MMLKRILWLAVITLFLWGCDIEIKLNETDLSNMLKRSVSAELNASKNIVNFTMDKGIFKLTGGEQDRISADLYRYPAEDSVSFDYSKGQLSIVGPEKDEQLRQWEIEIPSKRPAEINVKCNSADIDLNLKDVDLRKLDVYCAVGAVDLSLNDFINEDVFINIHNSVGNTKIVLPESIGVQLSMTGAMYRLFAPGFTEQDGTAVNNSYGKSLSTIYLNIICETGNVEIVQE